MKIFPYFYMSWIILGNRGLSKHWSWFIMLQSCWLLRGLGILSVVFFQEKHLSDTLGHSKPEKCYSIALCEGQFHQFKILSLHIFFLNVFYTALHSLSFSTASKRQWVECHSLFVEQHGSTKPSVITEMFYSALFNMVATSHMQLFTEHLNSQQWEDEFILIKFNSYTWLVATTNWTALAYRRQTQCLLDIPSFASNLFLVSILVLLISTS